MFMFVPFDIILKKNKNLKLYWNNSKYESYLVRPTGLVSKNNMSQVNRESIIL